MKQYHNALINHGSLTFCTDGETRFSMPLSALQGFRGSVFKLTNISLVCPQYICISGRLKEAEVSFKTNTRGDIQYLAISVLYGWSERFRWALQVKDISQGMEAPSEFNIRLPDALRLRLEIEKSFKYQST